MDQDIMTVIHDAEVSKMLSEALYRRKMEAIHFDNVTDAKAGLLKHSPAFLVLDCDMKGMNSLLSKIVTGLYRPHPYIIATGNFPNGRARASILRDGADSCVGKPIIAEEVLAIVEAVFRRERRTIRAHQGVLLPRIEHLELTIDPLRRQVTMCGDDVPLTVKEYEILYALASQAGTVLSKEEIYRKVWGTNLEVAASIVTDHISTIRKKLGLPGRNNDYIETVFGVGYRFQQQNTEK